MAPSFDRGAVEDFLQAATRQLSVGDATAALCTLRPEARRHLAAASAPQQEGQREGQHAKRTLVYARKGVGGHGANPFARPPSAATAAVAAATTAAGTAAAGTPETQQAQQQKYSWPSRSGAGGVAATGGQATGEQGQIIDLTYDSPPSSPPAAKQPWPGPEALPETIPPSPPCASPVGRGEAQQAQRAAEGTIAHPWQAQTAFYGPAAQSKRPASGAQQELRVAGHARLPSQTQPQQQQQKLGRLSSSRIVLGPALGSGAAGGAAGAAGVAQGRTGGAGQWHAVACFAQLCAPFNAFLLPYTSSALQVAK